MQPIRVLITDDDADAWDLLCAVCELDGFVVEVADDGVDALRMLLQTREPCIALLDIALPLMNGLGICAQLQQVRAAGVPVPRHQIVLMSAGVFPDGGPPPPARYMLRKPCEPARLRTILTELAQTIRAERDAVAAGAAARGRGASAVMSRQARPHRAHRPHSGCSRAVARLPRHGAW